MTKRRMGTRPHHTFWTPEGIALIEAYQAQHHIPSFSATAETLVRMGVERSPAEILEPIIVSTLRHELAKHLDRLVNLIVYDIIETGVTQRLAGAAVRDLGRLKQDDPERYDKIKAAAIVDTRRRLARDKIGSVLADLYTELLGSGAGASPANGAQQVTADGDPEGELPPAGAAGGADDPEGGAVLHLP